MTGIACQGGLTQIGRVLDHAVARRPQGAGRGAGLRRRRDGGGRRPALRARRASSACATPGPSCSTRAPTRPPRGAFREIARLTGGAYLPFDTRAAGELGALLAAVGAYAAGGRAALEAAGTGRAAPARRPRAMTAPLWAALALLAIGARLISARLPPRRAAAAAVLAAAAGLAALAAFALAVPVAVVGLGLWRRAGPIPTPRRPLRGRDGGLRMTLDHDTGAMDGEVPAGRFAGALAVGAVEPRTAGAGRRVRGSGDEDSLSLLLAYLDRRRTGRPARPAAAAGRVSR